jgi:hypothetical protein
MNGDVLSTPPMRVNPPEARESDRLRWLTSGTTPGAYNGRRKLARFFQNPTTGHRAAPDRLS